MDLDEEGSEKIDGMIKNWGRWSDIVYVKFPKIASLDIWLENILSIRVFESTFLNKIDSEAVSQCSECSQKTQKWFHSVSLHSASSTIVLWSDTCLYSSRIK